MNKRLVAEKEFRRVALKGALIADIPEFKGEIDERIRSTIRRNAVQAASTPKRSNGQATLPV